MARRYPMVKAETASRVLRRADPSPSTRGYGTAAGASSQQSAQLFGLTGTSFGIEQQMTGELGTTKQTEKKT